MRRNGTLEEISDGRLYKLNDLVKVGCHDCEGCSACCHNMEALILDPLDIYRLTTGLGRAFEDLLSKELELTMADQMIVPRMRMDAGGDACAFLDGEGRCSIHRIRPGICRLFPLGRYYHDDGFSYILQVHECEKKNCYKMKVLQWIDEPEPEKNRLFINTWHDIRKRIEAVCPRLEKKEQSQLLTYILKLFYQLPYEPGDFYTQFDRRMKRAKEDLSEVLFEPDV